MKKKLTVLFYVEYPYYFPHFLPISEVFSMYGHRIKYILSSKQNSKNMETIAKKYNIDYTFDENILYDIKVDIAFFANKFKNIGDIDGLTVFLEHGIGSKSNSFYPFVQEVDIYLTEGMQKYNTIAALYPAEINKLFQVGFSKFDAIVNSKDKYKSSIFQKYNLDKEKKTILYAPTFFPSSIEKMADNFPEIFSECNIIVKAHYLTFERSQYKKQVVKFNQWKQYGNVVVLPLEEYSIVPFLAVADVMISDESSAMFEFAALNKPVISNRFFKLRWSYYFMPWKLKARIDTSKDKYRVIFDNAKTYKDMILLANEVLNNPNKLEKQRMMFSKDICGVIDGKVSERIYDVIIQKIGSKNDI
jgi:CDP-glycerol glycerophosphotransferase (TagB/SpsB family)